MRAFWHPLSAVLLPEPPAYATTGVLNILLRAGGPVRLRYAGDRMWPALRHRQEIEVVPTGERKIPAGTVVLACPGGIPDALRVRKVGRRREFLLCGDADPDEAAVVGRSEILGTIAVPRRRVTRRRRWTRRLRLDLREAWRGAPAASEEDSAETVRAKYEAQAPFYAAAENPGLDPAIAEWVRRRVPSGGRILVAGSGAGRECVALARGGWEVTGVDFAPAMVREARRCAERENLRIRYVCADLRRHREPPGSLAAVLFTYDVYSFLPARDERIALLRRMREWLEPGGVVFVSARRVRTLYQALILSLERLARAGRGRRAWGDTHTRYIAPDGELRRSYVRMFTTGALRREAHAAGFIAGPQRGGHAEWFPSAGDTVAPVERA